MVDAPGMAGFHISTKVQLDLHYKAPTLRVAHVHNMEKVMSHIRIKTLTAAVALCAAPQAFSGFDFDLGDGHKLSFGGYIKADARYVDGDLRYQDYWRGNNPGFEDTSHTHFNVKETRFNTKYTHGDVTAFIEMDFYGGDGNEVATNGTNPRMRHAFVKYKGWMAGQYWSAFTPLKAFPEALDFGGPIVGEVFVRQPGIRWSGGGFTIAVENPETWGGDSPTGTNGNGGGATGIDADEDMPDLMATYAFSGDWGEIQAGVLARKLEQGGIDESAIAGNIGGKINVGKDDIRFQVNVGESGRYVGAGMVNDVVIDPKSGSKEVEDTTAFTVAYRHLWSDNWRSNIYYGEATTDVLELDRSHWGVNLIRQLTPALWVGVEGGQFSVDDDNGENGDSTYFQLSFNFGI